VSNFVDWIKEHQVVSFYVLVFGLSWPSMLMLFYVFPGNAGMQAIFGLIATFSPALVALIISTIAKPERKRSKRAPGVFVFFASWLFSWLVLSLHAWRIRGADPELQIIIPVGLVSLLPAWLVSCGLSRVVGVRELLGTLVRPKGHILWYVVAVLLVPLVQMVGAGITILAGGEVDMGLQDMTSLNAVIVVGLVFLQGFLVSGGINEETGWRGFVLPRLQARYSVIGAVVIVWFFWALWHVPYDIGTGVPVESILLNRILHNFVWSVLFAWVYNRTKGSLLAPALFHPAMNAFGDTLPRTDAATVLFVIITAAVIMLDRMWKRLPGDEPARKP
jgi:membrane protease YdiL (CAAX protease family)